MSDSNNLDWNLTMNLSDIIKTDADRLFYVDDECYILFTGDSVNDEHPFIRIGNWINMPVELIPLIKNIVITDNVTGNPSYEQFNIDPKHLGSNRYIGSAEIVKSYIEFQKLFDLDLSSVEIVDIKKDIPELSREKYLSDDDQFIGVFYRDGSFKTLHNRNTVIEIKGGPVVKDSSKSSAYSGDLYSGSGLIILNGNPVFFDNGTFVSYLLPGIETLKNANIDTRSIKAVIYPSKNYPDLVSFIKHRQYLTDKIVIYSDKHDDIRAIKKFFNNAPIDNNDLHHMNFGNAKDLRVENYPNSYNVRLTYKNKMRVAFIKTAAGVQHIIKDNLDAIIICYSAYKESVLLFKSTKTPIALINDTTESNVLSRLGLQNVTLLQQNIIYNLNKVDDISKIEQTYCGQDTEMMTEDITAFENMLIQLRDIAETDEAAATKLFNLISLLKIRINSSTDRTEYKQIQRLYLDFSRIGENLLSKPEELSHELVLHESGVYRFAPPYSASTSRDKIARFNKTTGTDSKDMIQIERDRARLMLLLALFKNDGVLVNEKFVSEIASLGTSIGSRRKQYGLPPMKPVSALPPASADNEVAYDYSVSGSTFSTQENLTNYDMYAGRKNSGKVAAISDKVSKVLKPKGKVLDVINKVTDTYDNGDRGRKMLMISLPLVLLVLIMLLIIPGDKNPDDLHADQTNITQNVDGKITGTDTNISTDGVADTGTNTNADTNNGNAIISTPSDAVLSKEEMKQYDAIPADFKSDITDPDIYKYVNKVAVKNGYRELSAREMKSKNPDRIFPNDTFIMLDEQVVTVVNGDTLWDLAARKLIELDIKFYETIKQIKDSSSSKKQQLIEQARSYAFSKRHMEIIESL